MSGVDVVTFGCRLNSLESEIIKRRAGESGLKDAVIVHTCAVTAEAERQARQAIRRAKRERPDSPVLVTGCSAQINPSTYGAMPEVDGIVGNDRKLESAAWSPAAQPALSVGDIMAVKTSAPPAIDGIEGRSRAFVQVQNGCDHRCTFCVIPYGRGNSRSVSIDDVLRQVRRFVAAGYAEIVLTGVDITSWGHEFEPAQRLGRLVSTILDHVSELRRLRLSSIDPAEIDPELFDRLTGDPRMMPHVHLSLQAGDDMILKRMKRRHLRDDVLRLTSRLRASRADMAFGADMIAGFPTETEAMFDNSLRIVEEAGLTFLHVFPYSPRPNTPAARMPQVDKPVRKARAARLRAAGDAAVARFQAKELGHKRMVLVERGDRGHTEHFAPIRLRQSARAGSIWPVAIDSIDEGMLIGSLAA